MKTILKIAWRNVWRNKLRSGVVFASVVMGIWAGLFVVSLSMGMMEQNKRNSIETTVSHLKIHSKEYILDEKVGNFIPENSLSGIVDFLENDDRIDAITQRTVIDGTIATAHGFRNIKIYGVDPSTEKNVTTIYEKLDTGSYFTEVKNLPILVGRSLAEELKIEKGKSANLSFITLDTTPVSIGFKTEAIFTAGGMTDKTLAFVKKEDLNQLLNTHNATHEVAVILKDINDADDICDAINSEFKDVEARPWNKVSPELGYADEMMSVSLMIILSIIILALTFGIINTMLMAILERKRELGMLLCVGMNKFKVFLMILFETIFLAIAAAPIGLLLAYGSISFYGSVGINLGDVEEAMYEMGYEPVVYTHLDGQWYGIVTVMIIGAAIVSSLLPARKALKYNPAEAVRAI